MRWGGPNKPDKRRDWHSWFAWFPVTLDTGERVWLESVVRRGKKYEGAKFEGGGIVVPDDVWRWEYKDGIRYY